MITYAMVLLTEIENIHNAERIEVQCGTGAVSICGAMVGAFVECTNHAYHDYPYDDCLAYGLTLLPPELRPIFEYLYEELKEVFTWNEQSK